MNARLLLAAILAAGLAACSAGSDGGAKTETEAPDADGDGLSDAEEATLGTSPVLADTDGDGYGDLEEVVQYGFDPVHNNYQFNPLVSDLPKVGIYFDTMPEVKLRFTTGTGTSKEVSTSHERGISESQSTSRSTSNSTAVEVSQTVGVEVTAGVEVGSGGANASASVTASYEASFSTTSEQTVSFSAEQAKESSDTWGEASSLAQDESTAFEGGQLVLAARVVNEGSIAFELRSITLGATVLSPAGEKILTPVGTLNYDGGGFPATTLGPGQTSGSLVFVKADLDLGTAQALLADASGLTVGVSTYELTDAAGLGFNHRLTEVHARTAQVVIDYAGRGGFGVERYNVATNSDPKALSITAKRALEILGVPYVVDASKRLTSVRGLAVDPAKRRTWNVVQVAETGLRQELELYTEAETYDFEALPLRSGDVLHLILMEDEDADGIGARQEFAYGLAEAATLDDDADGLADKDEKFLYGTATVRADTDGDGNRDGQEVFTKVVSGYHSTLAIAVDGSLWGWGNNEAGNLGPPTSGITDNCTTGNLDCEKTPVRIVFPGAPRKVISAAPGRQASAAVLEDGTVWTWGSNQWGGLADGTGGGSRATPGQVAGLSGVVSVSAGDGHFLALTSTGVLYAWGLTTEGQAGSFTGNAANPARQTVPLDVSGGPDWAYAHAGGYTSFAIRKDGRLNFFGAFPGEPGGRNFSPVGFSTDTDWVAVTGGVNSPIFGTGVGIALKRDGSLWTWGSSSSLLGRDRSCPLGNSLEATLCRQAPGRVGTSNAWVSVSASATNAVALRADGTLWTWGENYSGEAGYGAVTGKLFDRPNQVDTNTWRAADAGSRFATAIDRNFRLRAWGENFYGQVGVGDQTNRNRPTLVAQ